jgi:hypothetical protein
MAATGPVADTFGTRPLLLALVSVPTVDGPGSPVAESVSAGETG